MKTILLGMNNPYSTDPGYALYPHPENSAGARLCAMFLAAARVRNNLDLNRGAYIGGFDRANLINTPTWDPVSAKVRSSEVKASFKGRRVIICGVSVLTLLGLRRHEWLVWSERSGDLFKDPFDYCLIPHPSGRCREYNDPSVGVAVGDLLFKEWERANG